MTPVDCPSRRCTHPPARWPVLSLASIVLSLSLLAGGAQALGLGEIAQQSALGAGLRVVVPVTLAPGETLAGECVRLVGGGRGDGIPEVLTARVTLERSATGARLVVTSPRTVIDPVLKLTLQVGCDGGVRREYTMLMDPVPIEIPTATAIAAATPVPPATPSAAAPQAATGATAQPRASASSTRPRAARPRAGAAVGAAPGTAAASAQPTPARAPKAAKSAAPPAMVATAPQPKLTVSTAAPETTDPGTGRGTGGQPGASASDARRDPAQRALDAEAAALQLRVLELTAMVDRMQAEVRAAEAAQAAQAARFAAEKAALTSPQATVARWWSEGWPFVAGLFALAALIAALLSLRRRRAHPPVAAWPSGAAVSPARSVPASRPLPAAAVTQPGPAPVTQPEPAAAPTPAPQPVAKPPVAAPLDVSEVSHVTEEAGVYLAFNRPDRAMEVLEEHIRTSPHSLPAAWLMLLDLYHKQGREPEFNELAQRFHAQFNAQQPSWDAYRQRVQDERGLEGFPHIIRHLVAGWNKPECRDYLDHLLRENRDGRRAGFSLAAYEDIVFLRQLAEVLAAGPDARLRPVTIASMPRPAATLAAVPAPSPRPKRAPTLDLELALDEEMLDSRRALKTEKPKIA